MSRVPLKSGSVQVVVFCLSLMGTNVKDFLLEAGRILVKGGLLKIAELESRLEGDERGFIRYVDSGMWILRCRVLSCMMSQGWVAEGGSMNRYKMQSEIKPRRLKLLDVEERLTFSHYSIPS